MFRNRFAAFTATLFLLNFLTPVLTSAQQADQNAAANKAFDQTVTRVKTELELNDTQADQLRKILVSHTQKFAELRNRQTNQPYSPQIQAAIQEEVTAVKNEFGVFLSEEQKGKLATTNLNPVPGPPGFILVAIPPKTVTDPLPKDVRPIPAVVTGAKGGAARLTDDQRILHLLNRIEFGPRPGDIDTVKRIGAAAFLDQQLHPETINDSDLEKRLSGLPTIQMTPAELYQYYPPPNQAEQRAKDKNAPPVYGRPYQLLIELSQQKVVRAVDTNRQLQEVMTDFWFNHFNVFAQKDADLYLVTSYERDVLRPNALGKFRDLLRAVAESPAMLVYLDNWLSAAPDSKRPGPPPPPRPNPPAAQPPARPQAVGFAVQTGQTGPSSPPAKPAVMDEKNGQKPQAGQAGQADKPAEKPAPPKPPAPAPRKPGINENYARELMELHTLGVDGGYTQKDVQEVARCFTGWTIEAPNRSPSFTFRPWMHDAGAKTVLGVAIPPGGGISDAEQVIDILARSPATARFISKKLCQRFVADDPSPQLVQRVAQVFLKTDGDIREVLRAILTSPEFNSPAVFRAKVKSPLELAASAIRALDGDTNGGPPIQDWLRKTGEPLYLYTFPTGYGEDSSRWVNTGVFLNRLNFMVALANNQMNGTSYNPMRFVPAGEPADANRIADRLAALIVHTELGPESLKAVRTGVSEQAHAADKPGPVPASFDPSAQKRHISQAIELLLGTAEFQRK